MKKYFALFSVVVFILLWFTSELTTLESLSIVIFIYAFLEFLYDLGKRIVIMEFTVQLAIITCLIMPVIFYHFYTKENFLARLWVKYMPISSDDYFSYAIPGVLALAIGLRIPIMKSKYYKRPEAYMENMQAYLKNKGNLGLTLIGVGLVAGFLSFLSPSGLKQVFFLMQHLTFVGVFYVMYSPYKNKKYVVAGVIVLMLAQTIVGGMFGELIYLLACSTTLILLGKKINFRRKLNFALLGIFLIVILQSIKMQYRQRSWLEGGGADPAYFAELIGDRLTDLNVLLNPNNLFFTSVRMNQGWLVAVTMKQVPEKHPFGEGETIASSAAATIVPRFLWPDKPESGGKFNLKRYWGYNLVGYSMNLGPLGEGYANFDKIGGIIYMFFYGLFFNFMLSSILRRAEKTPSLILWLPFLFFYAISVETDLVTAMGSIVKGVFFTWLVYKIYKIGFRLDL